MIDSRINPGMDTKEFASSPAFFEAKYQKKADPWRFSSDGYELRRYEALVAALEGKRFRHAYEPGCSIGVLTERLGGICDFVDAIDFSPTASALAQTRCAGMPNVKVRCAAVPEQDPPAGYDLLVLSEIGYYFEPEVWARIAGEMIAAMEPGSTILAAHWLGYSKDHRTTGDQVHQVLRANPQIRVDLAQRSQMLRLERMVRV